MPQASQVALISLDYILSFPWKKDADFSVRKTGRRATIFPGLTLY